MDPSGEEREICIHAATRQQEPLIPLNRHSNFTHLKYIRAWLFRFANNCRVRRDQQDTLPHLSVQEVLRVETYWLVFSQDEQFGEEIDALRTNEVFLTSKSSQLLTLHPIIDSDGVLCVGGRPRNSQLHYSTRHPAILHGKHQVTKLIIQLEHLRLLHGGPTLVAASLCTLCHIIGSRKTIRSLVRGCFTCRRRSVRPQPQMLGQLPGERTIPGSVFDNVGVVPCTSSTASFASLLLSKPI